MLSNLLVAILGFLHLILFLWALVKILGSSMAPLAKVLWLLVVLFFPLGGLILYLLIGRKE